MEFGEFVDRQRRGLLRFATVLTCQTWLAVDPPLTTDQMTAIVRSDRW